MLKLADIPQLSVHFFSRFEATNESRLGFYDQLFEVVDKVDNLGFHAIWYPERHFDEFGGPYPSPAVMGAATAVRTSNVRIRAGSVVLPLGNPIRSAEEWSMIDLLSNGRVDIAVAQGWNPRDFAMQPDNYENRYNIMMDGARTIQSLWRGDKIPMKDGNGNETEISVLPPPVQDELSVWVTCSMGSSDRFYDVGKMGLNVLTALLFQSEQDLIDNITAYHKGRSDAGLDPHTGQVTLMLHTYLGQTEKDAKEKVWGPLKDYLKASYNLWAGRFEQFQGLGEDEKHLMFDFAINRYYQSSGLFGDQDQILARLQKLRASGVTEISCLMDFGVAHEDVLESIDGLGHILKAQRHAA